MRASTDDGEVGRARALGDPVAADALWDAYGPGAFAFCHRLLGDVGAAADATQDAFLLAHAERLERPEPGFNLALLRAARTTSFELLGGRARGVEARVRGVLSVAAARLRPQQRAALALAGLQGLSHAEIAAVLGIAREAVPALLARARLRLHDHLHGTALAAAAVASPDCEDVLPLLAAAHDGELEPAAAAWADPHVTRCPTCPRTIRAMRGAAATYAAWSPPATPSWLRAATLAEVDTREPAVAPPRRAALPAALVGATLASAASAALLVGGARSWAPEVIPGGARVPDAARSMQMAASARAPLVGARHQRSRDVTARRIARAPARAASVVSPAPPSARSVPASRSVSRLELTPTRRPASAPSPPAADAPGAPVPVGADVPADEPPAAPAVAAAASASASPAPSQPPPPERAAATLPPPKTVVTPPPPAPAGDDDGRAPCRASDGHHA